MKILSAGVIIIGDEVLSGRTKDTNSNFIAKKLIESGIKLEQIIVIKDDEKLIINTVNDFKQKFSYVFTTGGIGPTHDDITSKSISKAFKKKYVYNKEAYKILENYYSKNNFNEGRKKMARMPEGVKLIHNPLTFAPGYQIENVFVLPGVPAIMEKMFFNVLDKIQKGFSKKIITVNTNLFESIIAIDLEKIQKKYKKCSIGSYPYFYFDKKKGGVNIVISSWEMENIQEVVDEIKNMIRLKGGKSSLV
tara:strand:+ start:96 stop:842 length:747 start_codon:yes stop_codon:yes gene_type:complete